MIAWAPMGVDWWPFVADGLAKPWPREAVWFDLRWWHDRERMKRGEVPGRRQLAERWGWTERRARGVIDDPGAWWDESVPATSHERPSRVPATSQQRPTTAPTNASNPPETSHARPSDVPATSQSRPSDVPPLLENDGKATTSEALTHTPQAQAQKTDVRPVDAVWSVYRSFHPRSGEKPP